jgi:DNA-binding MarR family transcriptional regulator
MVMRCIHNEMRDHHGGCLSVPQFISLIMLSRHEGFSLSDLAEHIGLTLPAMSKMIEALFVRKLVMRTTHPEDRRRVVLGVTQRGQRILDNARRATQRRLARTLSRLKPRAHLTVFHAMQMLRPLFTPVMPDGGCGHDRHSRSP